MRHYEIIYIADPNLSAEEYREVIGKFNDVIEKQKGMVIKTQEWGKQRMAYEVKKFSYGFYLLIDFCAEPGVTAELERNLKLDDRILKFQTVKLADKVDPQELIKKEEEAKKVRTAEEEKPVEEGTAVQDQGISKEGEVKDGEK